MWQHGTVLESTEAIANSVITKFQPLEFWQLGKTFERGKANVDQAQWLQVDVFITQTFNLCGTRIVEIQFFNLERKVQFYCNLSTFLHFLPPHNNAALSYILTGGTRLTRLWRIWPSRYKLCYKRTKPPYCHTPSQTKFPFPNPFHPLFLSLKNLENYAKNFNKNRLAKCLYCKVGEKLFNCMRQLIDNTVHLSLPCFSAWEFYRSLYVCDWRPSPAHGGSSLGKID